MRRTSRARMRSLYRGSFCCGVAMAVHSCAMGCSPLLLVEYRRKAQGRTTASLAREDGLRCHDPDAPVPSSELAGGGRVGELVARVHPTSPQLSADTLHHVSE